MKLATVLAKHDAAIAENDSVRLLVVRGVWEAYPYTLYGRDKTMATGSIWHAGARSIADVLAQLDHNGYNPGAIWRKYTLGLTGQGV